MLLYINVNKLFIKFIDNKLKSFKAINVKKPNYHKNTNTLHLRKSSNPGTSRL